MHPRRKKAGTFIPTKKESSPRNREGKLPIQSEQSTPPPWEKGNVRTKEKKLTSIGKKGLRQSAVQDSPRQAAAGVSGTCGGGPMKEEYVEVRLLQKRRTERIYGVRSEGPSLKTRSVGRGVRRTASRSGLSTLDRPSVGGFSIAEPLCRTSNRLPIERKKERTSSRGSGGHKKKNHESESR